MTFFLRMSKKSSTFAAEKCDFRSYLSVENVILIGFHVSKNVIYLYATA